MPSIDMPLEQLREYRPPLTREADFEPYWKTTIAEALAQPLNVEMEPYDLPARDVQSFAVRYDGYKGGRIAGWYVRPKGSGKFPGICIYHGYSGRGTRVMDMLAYAYQGICVLSMDCRGQNGLSQDAAVYEGGHVSGWMTQGIRNPQNYYYRYVYADAVRALEVLAGRPEVDPSRLAVTGVSQGGGITIAAAALSDRPKLAMPDIPYLCHYRRAAEIAPNGPYPEIVNFVKTFPHLHECAFRTLSYCDGMNLAPWIKCRTMVLNCLWDDICPPSTIFAAYNHMTAPRQMEIYPYHKHEVPYEHREKQLRVVVEALKP
jgi:cephalosporin-C deacetylase